MYKFYRFARKFINVRREQQLRGLAATFLPVHHHSQVDNVYHCCVWKTASQWVRNVFSSLQIYRYSGLLVYGYTEHHHMGDDRPLHERTFDEAAPLRRIVSPLYCNYQHFAAMPKPDSHRAFFVARDPRDLVVSHFFSSKYSHVANPGVLKERSQIESLPESEGLRVHMRYMKERGIFDALRSWHENCELNSNCKFVRFEDLVGPDQLQNYMDLMRFCDIQIPEKIVAGILDRLSFVKLSDGRKQGEENKFHKYRSGTPGDWRKYFDQPMIDEFRNLTGDLIESLGYPE